MFKLLSLVFLQAEDLTAALAACKAQQPQTDADTANRVLIFHIDKKL